MFITIYRGHGDIQCPGGRREAGVWDPRSCCVSDDCPIDQEKLQQSGQQVNSQAGQWVTGKREQLYCSIQYLKLNKDFPMSKAVSVFISFQFSLESCSVLFSFNIRAYTSVHTRYMYFLLFNSNVL